MIAAMMADAVWSNSSAAVKRARRREGGVEVRPKLREAVAMSTMNLKAQGRRHLAMTFSPTSLKVAHSALDRGKRVDSEEEGVQENVWEGGPVMVLHGRLRL